MMMSIRKCAKMATIHLYHVFLFFIIWEQKEKVKANDCDEPEKVCLSVKGSPVPTKAKHQGSGIKESLLLFTSSFKFHNKGSCGEEIL